MNNEIIEALKASQNLEDSLKALGMDVSAISGVKTQLKTEVVRDLVENLPTESLLSLMEGKVEQVRPNPNPTPIKEEPVVTEQRPVVKPDVTFDENFIAIPKEESQNVMPRNEGLQNVAPQNNIPTPVVEEQNEDDMLKERLQNVMLQTLATPHKENVMPQFEGLQTQNKEFYEEVSVPNPTPAPVPAPVESTGVELKNNGIQVRNSGYRTWLVDGDATLVQTKTIKITRRDADGERSYDITFDITPISLPIEGLTGDVPVIVNASYRVGDFKSSTSGASPANNPLLDSFRINGLFEVFLLIQGHFENGVFDANIFTTGKSVQMQDTIELVSATSKGNELPATIQLNESANITIAFVDDRYFGIGHADEWDNGFSNHEDFTVKDGDDYFEVRAEKVADGWKVSY